MRPAHRLSCALAAIFALSLVPLARADTPPNPWDAARDPAVAARFALHRRVRELLANSAALPREYALMRARVLLEQARVETGPDVQLRIDLGEVYRLLKDYPRAIALLRPALDERPLSPAALAAFPDLANAYAYLDRSKEERAVYERFLPLVADEVSHATGMLNLAEANMHLGELDAAIAGYEAAIDEAAQLANAYELELHTGTLARWGLAVALDRAGDIDGGARAAKLAVQLDAGMKIMLTDENVFFAPERERAWYLGLGFTEFAKDAAEPRDAAAFWHRAEVCWGDYVGDVEARGEEDRWAYLAHARLERARAQRLAMERKVKGRIEYSRTRCVRNLALGAD